jgi:pimeloyl-ACP methyl ester carboxylesterase
MEHVISNDGTRIAFRRSGNGLPLLLVHGTTADHRRWDAILPSLEPHFTVVAMDRRGRGRSGDVSYYNFMHEAEDVVAVIETIDEPAFVLGHSFGGRCCLEASLLTDQIDRLILYEPHIPALPPETPPKVIERMQSLLAQDELETVLALFFREIVGMSEDELDSFRRLPMWAGRIPLAPTIPREFAIDLAQPFNPVKFAGLETPILLMVGGDSPPYFQQAIELLHATLPNNRVAVLPGQGHVAMDTAPELFVKEVLAFLLQ